MARDRGAAAVVDYWHAVEMFSPQSVPKVDPAERVSDPLDRQGRQPWTPGHDATRARLEAGQSWRHQVFCGLYEIEAVSDTLAAVVGMPRDTSDRRSREMGALASFSVTADGLAVPGSLTVSTCAWAVGRATNPGPRDRAWLSGFDEARVAIEEAFIQLTGAVPPDPAEADDTPGAAPDRSSPQQDAPDPWGGRGAEPPSPSRDSAGAAQPTPPRLLTPELLQEVVSMLDEHLGTSEALAPQGHRVRTRAVRRGSDADDDFLNSFYLDDLARVSTEVRGGGVGAALSSYLRSPSPAAVAGRLDVRTRLEEVAARLAPDTVPSGRWPDAKEKSLATSQQFAVATALDELSGRAGIFAVNGPPGTGKTTMLRDLIAGIVTERAARLATLASPTDAFTDTTLRYTADGRPRAVTLLKPELVGHEIVVASSNNAAVENVSREIPAATAVKDWPEPTPYFRDLAQLVLDAQAAASKNAEAVSAWGLLAAPLGKSDNRRALRNALLNGNEYDKNAGEPVPGLRQRLSDYEAGALRPSWAEGKRRFAHARQRVEDLRSVRRRHAAHLRRLDTATREAAAADRRLTEAASQLAAATDARAAADAALQGARAELEPRTAAWEARLQVKPTWWADFFSFGTRGARWREESAPALRAVEAAQQAVAEAEQAAQRARQDRDAAQGAERAAATAYAGLAAEVGRLAGAVASMHPALGVHDPVGWPQRADRERELQAPWLDEEFNTARTELFLAALDLHEAWIANAGARFRKNVLAAIDVLGGSVPRGNHDAVKGAWQSLFLVVPVISTTFASVDRMFTGLEREDLGWLVVDEAGQATPQAPVGALWRTQRAVVVGDPLQLEPVVSLKEPGQELLRSVHGVDERWMPSRSSLQTLADQLCRYGTELPAADGGDPRWVGAPLRVHRRCIDPMFTIANDLAYGGDLMIQAAVEKPGPDLPESGWRDVGGPVEGHWRPDQGASALEMLRVLVGQYGVPPKDIRVISPFTTVAGRLRAEIGREPRLRGVRAGTVHTTQGQEAPVVLLVLGGNPQSPGAKTFAITKPNLLNVALTRAQRRFYVVGERQDWIELPQFHHLSALPVWPVAARNGTRG